MSISNWALGLAALTLAASVVWRVALPAPQAPDQADAAQSASRLTIQSVITPHYHETRWETGDPKQFGQVRFELAEGEALVGIGAAAVYADHRGRPAARVTADFTGVQFQDGLMLGPWIKEGTPPGPHYLLCGLWVARDGRTEARRIWCRLDAGQLHAAALIVDAAAPAATPVRVATAAGMAVPGVLLGIEPDAGLPPGIFTTYAYTGDDGVAWVSGHSDGRQPAVRLLDGVGPVGELLIRPLETSASGTKITLAGLGGSWGFVRWDLDVPLRGMASKLDEWEVGESPRRVWPVSRWMAPGRTAGAALYWMFPAAEAELGTFDLRVKFVGRNPVVVKNAERAQRLTFALEDAAVTATAE